MSTNNHAVADDLSETYPAYEARIHDSYIEGYDPVSYAAPHSSLLRTSTWVGMGLIVGILPVAGILIWGLGTLAFPWGTAGADATTATIVGVISTIVVAVLGIVLITKGRSGYRAYRKETGRRN